MIYVRRMFENGKVLQKRKRKSLEGGSSQEKNMEMFRIVTKNAFRIISIS